MISLLLVEDETNVREPLESYLKREGFGVVAVASLAEARKAVAGAAPSAILLDWMLPDGQGIEWLKELRAGPAPLSRVPVLLLTARADLVDKVVGLELGADDYVTKPFEPRELVARIRARLRGATQIGPNAASAPTGPAVIEVGPIRVDPATHEARFRGREVQLTRTEFELLRFLVQNPDRVFTRDELLERVWGYDKSPTTRTVDTHVLQLRSKFEPALFETVHGVGYRFRSKT